MIRRLRAKNSPLLDDLGHFSDLLAACDLSPRQVAFACYGIAAIFAAVAWLEVKVQSWQTLSLSALCLAALIALSIGLGSLRGTAKTAPPARPIQPEAIQGNFETTT